MKKIYLKTLSLLIAFITLKQVSYCMSDNFKFVIDTIGIPRYNALGEQINEDVYYTYNVFSYSDPVSIASKTSSQRFKEVKDKGKWTKNGGAYKGSGIRGEYDILGHDYSGNYIYNVYFPVDAIPETTPDKWNYITVSGAASSWNDSSKYKYKEQLDYMKNSKLMFDSIDYSNNTINPYNLVEYNITASKIGLDKVVLNTAATWKTYGVVSVNRINNKGEIRYATLSVKPMAASANVKSFINTQENIVLDENNDEVEISINYGSNAVNLNKYAKKEHIKEIYSKLFLNGKQVSQVKDLKREKTSKTYTYKLSRDDYMPGTYTLKLSCDSYLYTEFSVDGLMQNNLTKNITIQVNPKKVVPIEDVKVKVLEKSDGNFIVNDLIQTKCTKEAVSQGFIEKEKHIAIRLSKGNIDFDEESVTVFLDDIKLDYDIIGKNNRYIILDVKIPSEIYVSVLGWETYRNISNNYYELDFENIGNRVNSPHILDIKYNDNSVSNIKIDTIDSFKYNFNYMFENGVEKINTSSIKVEDWLND